MLDRNQISPVEQLTDSHSKSPKLSTKTPLTKVSNLESLCEETTGDVFDSEAERVRVCPGMVGGEEHVFQQQSNDVKPTDRESASVVHSDHESTWIIQTDHESNDVTHSDHESDCVTHSNHNEEHEQENENGVLGSTEDTVDQQTVTMTTTAPGSVTPADTAATESGMTLVAENGGICQLETGDDEIKIKISTPIKDLLKQVILGKTKSLKIYKRNLLATQNKVLVSFNTHTRFKLTQE